MWDDDVTGALCTGDDVARACGSVAWAKATVGVNPRKCVVISGCEVVLMKYDVRRRLVVWRG